MTLRGRFDTKRRVPYEKLDWIPGLPVYAVSAEQLEPSDAAQPFEIKPHWHRSIETIYTNRSTTTVIINGEEVFLPEDTLFVINSRDVHSYPEASAAFTGCTLQIEYEFALELIPGLDDQTFVVSPEGQAHVLPLFLETARFYLERSTGDAHTQHLEDPRNAEILTTLCQALLLMLARFCGNAPDTARHGPAHDNQILQSILAEIDYRFTEDINLEALAEQLSISYSYLAKLVRANVGMSAKQYLTNKRYARGHYLLVTTDKPVAEIAYESGFPSTNAFIREFKKRDGTTPAAYRQRLLRTV